MKFYSTTEKNALTVISLLKAHGIRYVIASPGTTNSAFVGSIQNDPYFEIYSAVDERSAGYMACGLAAETGKPVVISCTGATASRNYIPGMTEAYYRKLPVLAVTSMQPTARVGHHVAQVIDRSSIPNDAARLSVRLPVVKDDEDQWECEVKVNTAILELTRHGGGPVHIDLPTTYSLPFTEKETLKSRVIHRYTLTDNLPELDDSKRIAVFVGAHKQWNSEESQALEDFCQRYNAVVFCDHTSGYRGKGRLLFSLAAAQELHSKAELKPDITLHIGEITGDYPLLSMGERRYGESARMVRSEIRSAGCAMCSKCLRPLFFAITWINRISRPETVITENVPSSWKPYEPRLQKFLFRMYGWLREWLAKSLRVQPYTLAFLTACEHGISSRSRTPSLPSPTSVGSGLMAGCPPCWGRPWPTRKSYIMA